MAWDRATLYLHGCVLTGNGSYGVHLNSAECGAEGRVAESHRFVGEADGSGNVVPSGPSDNGNQRGSICPSTYDFLALPE